MPERRISSTSTTGGLPVAPSMAPALDAAHVHGAKAPIDRRVLLITGFAALIAVAAAWIAQGLTLLIGLITNLSFYGRFSSSFVSPADHHLGWIVVLVPIGGGLIVGLMARYGSAAIRGHGIPEAMEQVLLNQSRIPPRVTFLKPLSAAISIGTGGPFGAEGPIIATGGALGSLVGQLLKTTADERKTLLAAGAAAGMAATFGSPVSAVLLAIELLLFEFRPRSFVPVALASTIAAATRLGFSAPGPVFPIPDLGPPSGAAIAFYIFVGGLAGLASVLVTRSVYGIEDLFDRLPLHWMWWPALGGIAVGVVGIALPETMGVGYTNIESILAGAFPFRFLVLLGLLKFVSWAIALGSGTSGGTLAPLLTIGGAFGAVVGVLCAPLFPAAGIDPRIAALVGMAAMFAGASRALLASVVFAFETTWQPFGLLPLLGGCSAAYLISCMLMRHSIMTEKIARRGVHVPEEYSADRLVDLRVGDFATSKVVTMAAEECIADVRETLRSNEDGIRHNGFPVVDAQGSLVGVVTRSDIFRLDCPPSAKVREVIRQQPITVHEDASIRHAIDLMVTEDVGRLPVVSRLDVKHLVGIITRSDLLAAYKQRLHDGRRSDRTISLQMDRLWKN